MWAGWCKIIHGNTNFPLTRVQQGCWLKVKNVGVTGTSLSFR